MHRINLAVLTYLLSLLSFTRERNERTGGSKDGKLEKAQLGAFLLKLSTWRAYREHKHY